MIPKQSKDVDKNKDFNIQLVLEEGDNTVSSSRQFHKPIVAEQKNAYKHLCVRRDEPE